MELTSEDRKELLRLARSSIESAFAAMPLPETEPRGEALKELSGAFVTLRKSHELRGCIGYVEARMPLYQVVEEVARKAAFEDPRFEPLTPRELTEVEIEISVLSPLRKITDVNEIEVGKHGLVIDSGYTRGLLLPQVATEHGWSRDQFLAHTALKAGLPPDAWKSPTVQISAFTSDVFSEAQFEELHH